MDDPILEEIKDPQEDDDHWQFCPITLERVRNPICIGKYVYGAMRLVRMVGQETSGPLSHHQLAHCQGNNSRWTRPSKL